MYHIEMTANIYNIESLTYRTNSLVLVRQCYDLFCGLFSYNDLFLPIQEPCQTIWSMYSNV